jgi:hypothetical protein
MAPRWEPSSDKHGVSRQDQIFAIINANFVHELDEPVKEGRIMVYIGPEHSQTDRELEILVLEFPDSGREASIFHAMPLGPKYRRYREEHPDGWK